jgi:hypothetical protein
VKPTPPDSGRSLSTAAVAAALGHFLTWAIGTITGINSLNARSEWWHTARSFFPMVTASQWTALIAWAATTGFLVAAGTRRRRSNSMLPLTAFVAGALVPVGLTFLGGALGRLWPGSNGPAAAAVMTLLLVAYSLAAPWLLGRLITRPSVVQAASRGGPP